MATAPLRNEEAFGLGLAVVAHVALFAWLALAPQMPAPLPLPEKMTVTLSEEAALQSTAPEPAARPDAAPELAPQPAERAVAEPMPQPKLQPIPRPLLKAPPKPQIKQLPKPIAKAAPTPRPTTPPKASSPPRTAASSAARPPGASRIGSDFLKAAPGARASGAAQNPPAAAIGPAVRSALAGAISRQLKPKWTAPQGMDAEKLVTILSWNLNQDGSVTGTPRVVRQDGITDANRAQAARHAEQAIRAVQLAAPFNLPAEYHDAWKRVADFRFDRKLSQ